jgi:hypothetical protein
MQNGDPEVSAWYANSVTGDVFEVTAISEDCSTIEYQLIDGEMGEFDQTTWNSLKLKPAAPPADWVGSLADAIAEAITDAEDLDPNHRPNAAADDE